MLQPRQLEMLLGQLAGSWVNHQLGFNWTFSCMCVPPVRFIFHSFTQQTRPRCAVGAGSIKTENFCARDSNPPKNLSILQL